MQLTVRKSSLAFRAGGLLFAKSGASLVFRSAHRGVVAQAVLPWPHCRQTLTVSRASASKVVRYC